MNTHLHRATLRLRLPLVLLMALLQRTPLARVLQMAESAFVSSPIGAVLKSAAAAVASLGAIHSLAGATILVATTTSPAACTVGQPISPIGFIVSNTMNTASWTVAGSFPPGLRLTASNGSGEITGTGILDVTMPGEGGGTDSYGDPIAPTGGITTTVPVLMGTPTQSGSYTFSLTARQGPLGLVAGPFNYTVNVAASAQPGTGPTFSTQPSSQASTSGGSVTLSAAASAGSTFEWQRNGAAISGASGSSLTVSNLQPANTGIYQARATSGGSTRGSRAAIVGLTTNTKIVGSGEEFPNIFHAGTGFTYDQILLGGAAASVKADDGQILRISFIDMTDDIVQVEYSGPGTLSLVLEGVSGPAAPQKYNQGTGYMKGHVGIVLAGATENTHLSVFSVGRANAVNQALFRNDVTYDGYADIAYIAITSANGQFGGLRAANTSIWNTRGHTGVYAPGVNFTGPVFVGDIDAREDANPVLSIGGGADVRITGGDLNQSNGRAVEVTGLSQLRFTAGSTSHGTLTTPQTNRARFETDGTDVTGQVNVTQ